MSLRRDLVVSYASQIYVTLIGIVMVPTYLRFMGAEAYGLVGFFAMLQAWFQLLDMGLSPTLSREAARYVGGATDALTLRRLLRVLEGVFLAVASGGALAMVIGADWIGQHWLRVEHISHEQLSLSIQLMGAVIGLRWLAALYRGALSGFELQVWLGQLNIAVATARFVGILPVFMLIGATPVLFFGYQLLVAGVETALLVAKTYRHLPAKPEGAHVGFHWQPLRNTLRFSLSIAFTGAVWVMVTQTDKLILSSMLTLGDYAYFSVAVIAASGVLLLSGPLSSVLIPRLSRLQAEGQGEAQIGLYRHATQWTAVIVTPVTTLLACAAEPLLWLWTGDPTVAAHGAPILRLYAIGNGVLALAAFPYFLQFAKGDLRMHLLGNLLFLLVLVPAIAFAARTHGATGAGWAWLGANAAYALLWVPLVHRRVAPGLHASWLARDVLAIALPTAAVTALLSHWMPWPANRLSMAVLLMLVGLAALLTAVLASQHVRALVLSPLRVPRRWPSVQDPIP